MMLVKNWGAKVAAGVIGAFVLAASPGGVASADVDDFYFSDYEVNFYLERGEDGVSRMDVVERLTAEFPLFDQNRGIIRIIPTTNQGGKNLVMDPDALRIDVRRNGQEEPAEIMRADDRRYHEVAIGTDEYVHGTQQYELRYAFERVITDFGEWQELYWDTNGTGWGQRFEGAGATVHLDEAARKGWTGEAWCYVGRQGESDQSKCRWLTADGEVYFRVIGELAAGENMTIVLKFKPGTFVVPEPEKNYAAVMLFGGFVVATGVVVGLMLQVWGRYKEKYLKWKRSLVPPEYTPPKGMTVGQAARLMIKGEAQNSLTATVMELAVRGKVKIVQKSKSFFGDKWELKVIDMEGLTFSERLILDLFNIGMPVANGTTIEMNKLQAHSVSKAVLELPLKIDRGTEMELIVSGDMKEWEESKKVKGDLMARRKSKWVTRSQFMAIGYFLLLGVAVFASVGIYNIVGVEMVASWLMWVAIAGGIFAAIWMAMQSAKIEKFAERTERGLRTEVYLQGLRRYMRLAETDRIKVLQSVEGAERIDVNDKEKLVKLYEKLLPYAVIFGIEKSWAKEMEPLYEGSAAPSWYAGVGAWSAADFASSMNSFSSSTSSAVSSSGASGSGGGGSSGGGGGGGGGGGR